MRQTQRRHARRWSGNHADTEKETMSIFAKRHYESVALAMQKTHPGSRDPGGLLAWNDVRAVMADTFKADNYKFDRERFMWACIPGRNARARTQHLRAAE